LQQGSQAGLGQAGLQQGFGHGLGQHLGRGAQQGSHALSQQQPVNAIAAAAKATKEATNLLMVISTRWLYFLFNERLFLLVLYLRYFFEEYPKQRTGIYFFT